MIKTHFNITITCIRSDNGSEFILMYFYKQFGIIHQTYYVGTRQQNEIVERKHQHILGITQAILFQSKLPHIIGLILLVMHFTSLIDCLLFS